MNVCDPCKCKTNILHSGVLVGQNQLWKPLEMCCENSRILSLHHKEKLQTVDMHCELMN